MEKLMNVEPIDGYGESTVSLGQAIGAANEDLSSKFSGKENRGIVSAPAPQITIKENKDAQGVVISTTHIVYFSWLITTYNC